jgi:hypothetical protein
MDDKTSAVTSANCCRLCLLDDGIKLPIFEGEGVQKQVAHKIQACFPILVIPTYSFFLIYCAQTTLCFTRNMVRESVDFIVLNLFHVDKATFAKIVGNDRTDLIHYQGLVNRREL